VGAHRKYSKEDLARLLYMHKLVVSGVSPADAAKLAVSHSGSLTELEVAQVATVDGDLVSALHRAAKSLDRKSIESQIRTEISRHGVGLTWINLLVPLLCAMGEEWEQNGSGIAAEHMVTDVIKKVFAEKSVVTSPRNEIPVLLACVGEEMHSLAITALAAALAEESIQVQFLGARTPAEAIVEVVRKSVPPAIFLWAQLPENASAEVLAELPTVRPAPRVILGGPGWAEIQCEGVARASDLASACREISDALGL
jgi:methanogenic corrinoid protein MtbC1